MEFKAKHVTVLGAIILFGFFGYAMVDAYVKNQPQVQYVATDVVEEIVKEMFKGDSVVSKPIVYKYTESEFTEGEKSYWFFYANVTTKKGETVNNTRVIEFPYPFFDFKKAGDLVANKDTKQVFITYFRQISEASYASYSKYAEKY